MIGYRCFNRTSTGHQLVRETPRLGREGYWEREKVFDLPQPVLDQTSTIDQLDPQLVEPVGHSLDRLSLFSPENLFFLFLSFLTLRQGL